MTTWRPMPDALALSDLSDGAVRLYAIIATHGNRGKAWPSQELLEAESRRSRSAVQRAIRELRRAGWVDVEQRPTSRGGWANVYTIKREVGVSCDANPHDPASAATPGLASTVTPRTRASLNETDELLRSSRDVASAVTPTEGDAMPQDALFDVDEPEPERRPAQLSIAQRCVAAYVEERGARIPGPLAARMGNAFKRNADAGVVDDVLLLAARRMGSAQIVQPGQVDVFVAQASTPSARDELAKWAEAGFTNWASDLSAGSS